jgi:hypothetical protein
MAQGWVIAEAAWLAAAAAAAARSHARSSDMQLLSACQQQSQAVVSEPFSILQQQGPMSGAFGTEARFRLSVELNQTSFTKSFYTHTFEDNSNISNIQNVFVD